MNRLSRLSRIGTLVGALLLGALYVTPLWSIRFVAPHGLPEKRVREVRERLAKAHPLLGAAVLERVEALDQTVAGKTRIVVNG